MSISTVAYEGATRFLEYTAKSFKDKGVGLTHIWTDFEKLEGDFLTIAGKKAGEKAGALETFAAQLIASLDWLLQVTKARDAFRAIEKAGQAVNDAVNNTIDKVKGNGEKDVDGFLTRIGKEIKEFFMGPEKKAVENTEKKLEKAVDEQLGKPADNSIKSEKTEKPADLEKPANDKPPVEKLEDSKGKHYTKTTSDGLIKQEVNVNGNVGGNVNVTQNQYLGQQQHTSSWFDPAKKAENDKFFTQMRDDIVDTQKAASIAEAKKNPVTPESHIQLSEN